MEETAHQTKQKVHKSKVLDKEIVSWEKKLDEAEAALSDYNVQKSKLIEVNTTLQSFSQTSTLLSTYSQRPKSKRIRISDRSISLVVESIRFQTVSEIRMILFGFRGFLKSELA